MGAGIASSDYTESASPRSGHRRVRTPVGNAAAADLPAVAHFLNEVVGGPSAAEFKASVEDPAYQSRDRLLLRRGQRLVAHAHLTRRLMQCGSAHLPAAGLRHLCVAPSCRGQGLGRHLLTAAERQMAEYAAVGLMRTAAPHFFRRSGWALCGRHSYSRADARALLARMLDHGLHHRKPRALHIRPWRQWELGALARIYNQNLPGSWGALHRHEAYWQWLVQRQAFDQIYVALEGPELLDLREEQTRIVGYAVVRGEAIVELLTSPDRPRAAWELTARVCGDAIEHDRCTVTLFAPAEHPLHAALLDAGGLLRHCDADRGEVYMARLLDPLAVLRRLCGELHRRAERARLPRPFDLGLLVEGRKYQIEVNGDEATVTDQRLGRSYLRMNVAEFTRLLLGQLDWDWALKDRRLEVSTALAEQVGRVLFPVLPFYRPVLDDLEA
jgi:predicted N-acetyltransferase YhbS